MVDTTLPVRPGDLVADKYRVERVLGCGAMGVVVAARHAVLEQLVAIKFIRPEALANEEVVRRFLREAKAAAQLRGEHVARVMDVGSLVSGAPYIVMEHLAGIDLATHMAGGCRLPVPVAVDWVLQACEGIAEAHAAGVIHRDLKPANLFLIDSPRGRKFVKVLDFGISKTTAPGELAMTGTSMIVGSPAYMSPEQMRSAKTVDARADIWSLGIILWELVTGRVPFVAETFTELCLRIAIDPLPPLPPLVGAPRGFESALRRCLERDLSLRYRTIGELASALEPFRARSSAGLPLPAPAELVSELSASSAARGERMARTVASGWRFRMGVGLGAALLAVGILGATYSSSRPDATVRALPPPGRLATQLHASSRELLRGIALLATRVWKAATVAAPSEEPQEPVEAKPPESSPEPKAVEAKPETKSEKPRKRPSQQPAPARPAPTPSRDDPGGER